MLELRILTEHETMVILEQLAKGHDRLRHHGLNANSADIAIKWAKQVRVDDALLDLVLKRQAIITIDAGDIKFALDAESIKSVSQN